MAPTPWTPTTSVHPGPVVLTLGEDGFVLRPWASTDADPVLALFQDPDVVRWDYLLPMVDRQQAEQWLAGRERGWADGSRASWAVTGPDDEVVGSLTLSHLELASSPFPPVHATISYHLLPTARGHGLATRGSLAATAWLQRERGLHRVELRHDIANTASCAVAERSGFRLEGVLRSSQRTAGGWTDEHLHALVTS